MGVPEASSAQRQAVLSVQKPQGLTVVFGGGRPGAEEVELEAGSGGGGGLVVKSISFSSSSAFNS